MSTTENSHTGEQADAEARSKDSAQIEADIARHRAELGRTVDELSDRLDVKKQAQEQIHAVKADLTDRAQKLKVQVESADPAERAAMAAPVVGAAVGVGLLIALVRRLRR